MAQTSKIALIKDLLDSAETSLKSAKQMLAEISGIKDLKSSIEAPTKDLPDMQKEGDDKIVEGIFNGETMKDKTGKEYPVPANYASKSKLVAGDILKLTIKLDGGFLYKQIGPVERKRVIGILTYEDSQYRVIAEGKVYRVLLASVTYFKAEVGDKVTIIVNAQDTSDYGAIENVLPKEDIALE
ncbi:MAG: hypothetical protein WC806_03265 [Candidatus Gracilibacteria bacterium]|jgi:hypothetical protein